MARKSFDKLSRAEERVVIAKDLIARLDAKEFIAESGTYLYMRLTQRDLKDGSVEVRDILKTKRCKGCQIGGLFLCAVDQHNQLSLDDIGHLDNNDSGMRTYLGRFFTELQLREVERAFEQWGRYKDWDIENPAKRMRAIAMNIIKNKGRFIGGQLLNA